MASMPQAYAFANSMNFQCAKCGTIYLFTEQGKALESKAVDILCLK